MNAVRNLRWSITLLLQQFQYYISNLLSIHISEQASSSFAITHLVVRSKLLILVQCNFIVDSGKQSTGYPWCPG